MVLKDLIKYLKKLNLNIKNLLNKFSMKKKNIIPLYKTDLLGDEKNNIIKCINENWISSKGSFIEKFQEDFKKKFKYKHATVTTSGTTALHLALLALDIILGFETAVIAVSEPDKKPDNKIKKMIIKNNNISKMSI